MPIRGDSVASSLSTDNFGEKPLTFFRYWWEIIKLVLRGVPGHSQTVIFLLYIGAGLIGSAFPLVKWIVRFMGWGADLSSWQTALMAIAAVVTVRLLLA